MFALVEAFWWKTPGEVSCPTTSVGNNLPKSPKSFASTIDGQVYMYHFCFIYVYIYTVLLIVYVKCMISNDIIKGYFDHTKPFAYICSTVRNTHIWNHNIFLGLYRGVQSGMVDDALRC